MTRKKSNGNKRLRDEEAVGDGDVATNDRRYNNSGEILRQNQAFEQYYRQQDIVPAGQWDAFITSLQTDLPSSFRIVGNRSRAVELRDNITRVFTGFGSAVQQQVADDQSGPAVEAPIPIAFYPNQMAWQYSIPRRLLRRSKELAGLQEFLINENEVGNISRQEAVSMIPPLLLDVQPDHWVLDMCAAPGSKTSQIVEWVDGEAAVNRDMFSGSQSSVDANGCADSADKPRRLPRGLVIANDADNKRCYTLIHRIKSLQSPSVLVTNHDASQFPTLYTRDQHGAKRQLYFDRILCDVPCSGDGTMRKNPLIWRTWNPNNAIGLHSLQIKILTRAVQMLKPGGRIVYSTCSFNPVENEAVVATVLRRFPGSLRLLNVDDQLPDLKRRPGLCTWKLMTKAGEIFDTYDQMPDNLRRGLPPTLFTPERNTELELGRCIRVLPHHQNTGGFFIAVFEKSGGVEPLAPEQLNVEPTATEAEVSVNPQQAGAVFKSINGEAPFIFLKNDSPATVGIREQFDLTGFPVDQLLVRSDSLKSSIYFVSESIKRILECPDNARLTVVNTGVKAFGTHEFSRQPPEENKMNNNSLPPLTEISASVAAQSDKVNTHRVHQEILSFILPHLPVDKIVDITMKDLELCIRESYPFFNQFSDEVCKRLEQARYGGMVLRCKVNGMLLAVWRAKKSVNLLLNKQEKQCLLNRLRIFGLIGERKEEIIGEQPSVETHF